MMKCLKCGRAINEGFMCDRQEKDGMYCEADFNEATGCSEETHGEGCLTMVFDDETI